MVKIWHDTLRRMTREEARQNAHSAADADKPAGPPASGRQQDKIMKGEMAMPKSNAIERPQVDERNANKNIEQVRNDALDNRNRGNTKEEK